MVPSPAPNNTPASSPGSLKIGPPESPCRASTSSSTISCGKFCFGAKYCVQWPVAMRYCAVAVAVDREQVARPRRSRGNVDRFDLGRQITSAARSQSGSTLIGLAWSGSRRENDFDDALRIADDVPVGDHEAVLFADVDQRAAAIGGRAIFGHDDPRDGRVGRHVARCGVVERAPVAPQPRGPRGDTLFGRHGLSAVDGSRATAIRASPSYGESEIDISGAATSIDATKQQQRAQANHQSAAGANSRDCHAYGPARSRQSCDTADVRDLAMSAARRRATLWRSGSSAARLRERFTFRRGRLSGTG